MAKRICRSRQFVEVVEKDIEMPSWERDIHHIFAVIGDDQKIPVTAAEIGKEILLFAKVWLGAAIDNSFGIAGIPAQ